MTKDDLVVGYHAVRGALESGRAVEVVWVQRDRRDRRMQSIVELSRRRGVLVERVPRSRLDRLALGVPHNGCAARTAPVAYVQLEDLVRSDLGPSRILVLDDVADPHNLGAVIRSAAAFSMDGIVVAGHAAPPLGGAVAKAAVGMLEVVPLARARVAADALTVLRGAGYWLYGADRRGSVLSQCVAPERWVLCIGGEERGLRAKTRATVDELIAIPIARPVESLNLSVAAGILMYALGGR
jgi:23S rRNA (guanosine2251-2'-O)-methyltransferase